MYDLGTEIGQLHRLVVRHAIDHTRLRHASRIRAHHAVDVGPYRELARVSERRENGRRKVAAVAAERRLQSFLVGRNEAREDRDPGEIIGYDVCKPARGLIPQHGGPKFCMPDNDHLARVDPGAATLRIVLLQQCRQHTSRPDLPIAGHDVATPHRGSANQRDRLQDVANILCVPGPGVEQAGSRIAL